MEPGVCIVSSPVGKITVVHIQYRPPGLDPKSDMVLIEAWYVRKWFSLYCV